MLSMIQREVKMLFWECLTLLAVWQTRRQPSEYEEKELLTHAFSQKNHTPINRFVKNAAGKNRKAKIRCV